MADIINVNKDLKQIIRYNDFKEFLKKDIPIIPSRPKTFLEIAKQPHYENVLSNILSFYFKADEEHGLQDLFITSLVKCINHKLEEENHPIIEVPQNFSVETEVLTDRGGRIDLLISNEHQAIIIENKVYHTLINNLDDYFSSITVDNTEVTNKVGVVLSLRPIKNTNHEHFINITHYEFLQKVLDDIGPYLMNAKEKFLVFLKDLYQNTINRTQHAMTEETIAFYMEHKKAIQETIALNNNMQNYIVSEIEKAALSLENVTYYMPRAGSDLHGRARYYISTVHPDLMFVITFDEIISHDTIFMAVELKNQLLLNKERYQLIQDTEFKFSNKENELIRESKFFSNTNTQWAHFAGKHFKITPKNMLDLSGFIINTLEENHLLSIFHKLEGYLKNA